MSYIFEALKKLDQKRHREGASRLLMATGEVAPERKRWAFWPLPVLAALLLLNAAVMIWWVRPWAPHEQPTPTESPAASGSSATASQGAREEDRSADLKEIPQPKTAVRSTAPVAEKKASDISRTEHAPATKTANVEPKVRPERRVPADVRVLGLRELPPAIKSSLPALKISAHYYTAEPQARFTRINELNLKEGQVLAPGVKLEEITPEGVVLSYQGYRFRMGINENQ